jgi:anhydro-N-acetylmuramic acid kinase
MDTHLRFIIGCMTGTSIDGLDAAVVRIEGRGLAMRATLVNHQSVDLAACQEPLRALALQSPMPAGQIAQLAHDFALLHVRACEAVWEAAGRLCDLPRRPSLISVHGQTVWHRPPVSWQLFQPAPLARAMQCPVVCDLRQADLAAGGQGAPLTPLADYVLFARAEAPLTVVNFGGFCNLTSLPRRTSGDQSNADVRQIRGADLCPCNHLLDEVSRRGFGRPFDEDGREALAGTPVAELGAELRALLAASGASGRSLGTGDECLAWVARVLRGHRACDVAATVAESIGAHVAGAASPDSCVMCFGGGVRHRRLMEAVGRHLGRGRLLPATVAPDAREAACWAVLGGLAQDGVELGVAAVTGRPSASGIAGLWVS